MHPFKLSSHHRHLLCRRLIYNRPSHHVLSHSTAVAPKSPSLALNAAPPSASSSRQLVDFTSLAACASSLSHSNMLPSKVEQCIMWRATDIALRLRNLETTTWLNISWHSIAARVCLGGPPTQRGSTSEAFTFGEQLHSNLYGLVLVSCTIPQLWERVIQLQFGKRPGDKPTRSLYCEIMARYSNLILTDEEGMILAAAAQVGSAKSNLRLLQTGSQYHLPPITQGIPPSLVASEEEEAAWRDILSRASILTNASNSDLSQLSSSAKAPREGKGGQGQGQGRLVDGFCRSFQGVSPQLVEQLCIISGRGLQPHTPVASMSEDQWQSLRDQWNSWIKRIESGSFECSSSSVDGKYCVIGSTVYDTPHLDLFSMLDSFYSELQGSEIHSRLHHRLTAAVALALKKAQGRKYAFEKQLKEADKADEVQRQGDMITANLYRIKAGMAEVTVESWETGEPVVLKLEPLLSPVSYAEGIFKKARKLRRAIDAIQPLMETVESEMQYLDEVASSLEGLKTFRDDPNDYQALEEVKEELISQNILGPEPDATLAAKGASKGKKGSKSVPGGKNGLLGFRVFVSPSGYEVLIGRNNRQNDELSNRVAQPDDLWMHVRGCPGSHAIIRVSKGLSLAAVAASSSPPQGQGKIEGKGSAGKGGGGGKGSSVPEVDVQFAADLCAFFSRGKENGKADVIVALAKDLKKPRGGKPGQIMVVKELRNIVARPQQAVAAAERS